MSSQSLSHRSLVWVTSVSITIALTAIIILMLIEATHRRTPDLSQLSSERTASSEVGVRLKSTDNHRRDLIYVPTGVFLQSLEFSSANEVYLTGYIWQKRSHDEESPSSSEPGFILPEAVNEPHISLTYQDRSNGHAVYGWYFEATLRQYFEYDKFPLDSKTVWIRLWPSDLGRNTVLTPALDDYENVSPGLPFGLDQDLVLEGWDITESFFNYRNVAYDTSFGYPSDRVSSVRPELYFNVTLRRKFLSIMLLHIIPLLTVTSLIFAVLMTMTGRDKLRDISGFSVTAVLGIISALFFVVSIAHSSVRSQINSDHIVYIEWFYILMYIIMIGTAMNAFMFILPRRGSFFDARRNDNLFAKVLFWPLILSCVVLFTNIVLLKGSRCDEVLDGGELVEEHDDCES